MSRMGLPPLPWIVEGVPVDLVKDSAARTLRVVVPSGCLDSMTNEAIAALLAFTETARQRFADVLPDWKVTA